MSVIQSKNLTITKKLVKIENKTTTAYGHDKYITTQEFNKLILEGFTAKLKQVNLASKNYIANFVTHNFV